MEPIFFGKTLHRRFNGSLRRNCATCVTWTLTVPEFLSFPNTFYLEPLLKEKVCIVKFCIVPLSSDRANRWVLELSFFFYQCTEQLQVSKCEKCQNVKYTRWKKMFVLHEISSERETSSEDLLPERKDQKNLEGSRFNVVFYTPLWKDCWVSVFGKLRAARKRVLWEALD